MLAKRWREDGDRDAARRLVTSHLRLVVKIMRRLGIVLTPLAAAMAFTHRNASGGTRFGPATTSRHPTAPNGAPSFRMAVWCLGVAGHQVADDGRP
jgi:hypothetical protein